MLSRVLGEPRWNQGQRGEGSRRRHRQNQRGPHPRERETYLQGQAVPRDGPRSSGHQVQLNSSINKNIELLIDACVISKASLYN